MEGQCKATKSNADCFAEDLKPVSEKKSQNEDECRKSRCLATEARSATALKIVRSQNFESMTFGNNSY